MIFSSSSKGQIKYFLQVIGFSLSQAEWGYSKATVRSSQIIQAKGWMIMMITLTRYAPALDKSLLLTLCPCEFFGRLILTPACRFRMNQLRKGGPDKVQPLLLNTQTKIYIVECHRECSFIEPPNRVEYIFT